jgi:hypothetical protein
VLRAAQFKDRDVGGETDWHKTLEQALDQAVARLKEDDSPT